MKKKELIDETQFHDLTQNIFFRSAVYDDGTSKTLIYSKDPQKIENLNGLIIKYLQNL